MKNLVVFEGLNETIIASASNINAVIKDWFLEGGRSLDDYDTYLVNGDEGFAVSSRLTSSDSDMKDFDVTELMPNVLREGLIEAGLLTDEG